MPHSSPHLQLGQEVKHSSDGVDVVTGIKSRVKTRFGRPNWRKELTRVRTGACLREVIVFPAASHPSLTKNILKCY